MKKILTIVICVVLLVGMVVGGFTVWNLFQQATKEDTPLDSATTDSTSAAGMELESQASAVTQAAVASPLMASLTAAKSANPEVVAWISLDGTTINSGVAQDASASDKYATTAIDGTTPVDGGSIYLDSNNANTFTDFNNDLYGSNQQTMFGSLANYADSAYFNTNSNGTLQTETTAYSMEIFSYIGSISDDDFNTYLGPATSYEQLMNCVTSYSSNYRDIGLQAADHVVTMSSTTDDGNQVLIAKITPATSGSPVDGTVDTALALGGSATSDAAVAGTDTAGTAGVVGTTDTAGGTAVVGTVDTAGTAGTTEVVGATGTADTTVVPTAAGSAAATFTIPAQNAVSGTPVEAATFAFTLQADDASYPMPDGSASGAKTVSCVGAGTIDFGTITYPAEGTFTYKISEMQSGISNYTLDQSTYMLSVFVVNTNGTLTTTSQIKDAAGTEVSTVSFNNTFQSVAVPAEYSSSPEVAAAIDGTATSADGTVATDGTVAASSDAAASTDASTETPETGDLTSIFPIALLAIILILGIAVMTMRNRAMRRR